MLRETDFMMRFAATRSQDRACSPAQRIFLIWSSFTVSEHFGTAGRLVPIIAMSRGVFLLSTLSLAALLEARDGDAVHLDWRVRVVIRGGDLRYRDDHVISLDNFPKDWVL